MRLIPAPILSFSLPASTETGLSLIILYPVGSVLSLNVKVSSRLMWTVCQCTYPEMDGLHITTVVPLKAETTVKIPSDSAGSGETTKYSVDMFRSAFIKNTSWLYPASWLLPITAIGSVDRTITPLFSTPLLHRKLRLTGILLLCVKGNM